MPKRQPPELAEQVKKLNALFNHALKLGMKTKLLAVCNNGFSDTPKALRAVPTGCGFAGTEICPSRPEGLALILENHRKIAQLFEHIDCVSLWSYDEGGCGCSKCAPWGSNGMFNTGRRVAEVYRERFPGCNIEYSTWLFDYRPRGEWEGLYRRMAAGEADWIDWLLADSHSEFPRYPLEHREPWAKPIINFPEISMYKRSPWGGFGATMFPERLKDLWQRQANLPDGGEPYSEGLFEDVNKIVCFGFYWAGTTDYDEILAEYARYELGIEDYGLFKKFIAALEDNHAEVIWSLSEGHWQVETPPENWRRLKNKPQIYTDLGFCYKHPELAWELAERLEKDMPEHRRSCWRWRLLKIRARFDFLLGTNGNEPNDECEKMLEELAAIYQIDTHDGGISTCPYSNSFLSEYAMGNSALETGQN